MIKYYSLGILILTFFSCAGEIQLEDVVLEGDQAHEAFLDWQ